MIKPRRELLARYGVTTGEFGRTVGAALGGAKVGEVYAGNYAYDITVILDDEHRASIADIGLLPVSTPEGAVPLEALADISVASGPNSVNRENAQRRLLVTANVEGRDLVGTVDEDNEVRFLFGIDGKFVALKWCRENDVPTFGICLGMQCMVIEFARNVLGLEDANSTEMNPHTPENVIDLMEEQKNISNMGGTMRLGAYDCRLRAGSKAAEAYGKEFIRERHRHRFEFNNDYRDRFEAAGMACVGENPDAQLVEVVEMPSKRWYIGTQYHPEYSSTVLSPSPIFASFIEAAIDYHDEKATK